MNDYTPNSNKAPVGQAAGTKVDKKDIIKPIKGEVKIRKKGELHKLADVFLPEDFRSIKEHIFTGVLVPLLKKGISDIVDTVLWGESRRRPGNGQTYTSYSNYYDYRGSNNNNNGSRFSEPANRPGYADNDITLGTRGDAEQVIDQLNAIIDAYGAASVADLYDILGKSCSYTDNDYGWRDLRDAGVERAYGGGYRLVLPKARSLK